MAIAPSGFGKNNTSDLIRIHVPSSSPVPESVMPFRINSYLIAASLFRKSFSESWRISTALYFYKQSTLFCKA